MAERLHILAPNRFASTDMGDLSGKTFENVYVNNKTFRNFTLEKMETGTGIFKLWLEFIKLRHNERRSSISGSEAH